MAGHSKFKNIQHRKGRQDKLRSKMFSKLGKEIMVAAKMGAPDPDMNPRLRLAILNAKSQSVPNDTIKRAVEKGSGAGADDENFENVRYEGYGPHGVAVIVEALTDNRNRSAADIRAAFSKSGGNLGETGNVAFMFDHVGEIVFDANVASEDEMFEAALEAGASNVESDDETHEIICDANDFAAVSDALTKKYNDPKNAGLVWRANMNSPIETLEKAESVMRLVDMLEDNDDVQKVYTNVDISDEIMDQL